MPSIETMLFQAVKARVNALPMKAAYPIVWSTDEAYVPSISQPYLRATWLPNTNIRHFHKGSDPHERLALLQIDVMGEKTNGEGVAIEIAGQVAAHFAADTPMFFEQVKMSVTKAPDVGPVFVNTHIQVPVTIRVRAFA
jgi:hypothetical protein